MLVFPGCSPSEPQEKPVISSAMVELSLEELVSHSEMVLVGVVKGSESRWDADNKHIYTSYNMAVEEWIKGQSRGSAFVIKVPGGQVGGKSEWVEDMAEFRKGERVVVFLKLNSDRTGDVVGGFQGKLVVENGEIVGRSLSLNQLISQIKEIDSK